MSKVIAQKMTAEIEGDFVVFLIGMRINTVWKPRKWLPVVKGMQNMLTELGRLPSAETGFLGFSSLGRLTLVQYWRSFDHLETYARSRDHQHFPAWIEFNKRMKECRGAVGIWHETYLVGAGRYEAVYAGMPPHGLGQVAGLVPATGNRKDARDRLTA